MWTEALLRLGAAAMIGAAIGLNRELHRKSAGFRTLGIVAVGVALATFVATTTSTDTGAGSRVIQGVLAGIGFLGAGVIVRHTGSGDVEGLTTAASIWTAAALGAACGLGAWQAVTVAAALVLSLLGIGGAIEARLRLKQPAAQTERQADSPSDRE
jgi:putative Mg2+ transporter-C (MgtC) family protein